MAQQNLIGWKHVLYGRWGKRWVAPTLEPTSQEENQRLRKWVGRSIAAVWYFLHERWKERTELTKANIHGVLTKAIRQSIKAHYREKGHYPSRYAFLFNSDLSKLTDSPISHMKYWLQKVGTLLDRYKRRAKRQEGNILHYITRSGRTRKRLGRNRRRARVSVVRGWEIREKSRRR